MDRTSLRLEQSHVKFIKSSTFFPLFFFFLCGRMHLCMIRCEKEVPFHLRSMKRVVPNRLYYVRCMLHPDFGDLLFRCFRMVGKLECLGSGTSLSTFMCLERGKIPECRAFHISHIILKSYSNIYSIKLSADLLSF